MANVSFKKGLLANLPAAINEGTFYITTDERAMYLDVDSTTRVRIGDFQEFATLAALQANTNPSTTALYYVTELNVLAKWDGTKYVQINLDTGATSAEVTGAGNAIDGVSYDAATRKLTFTKTTTFATTDDVDSKIAAKVGDLTLGDVTYETVKAYVDKKTDGIATDAALETLTQRVTTAESDIDALQADVTTLNGDQTVAGSVDKKINDAIIGLEVTDIRETGKYVSAVQQVNGKIVVTREELPDYSASIAAAKQAGDDAQADVDALETLVGTIPAGATATTVVGYVDEAIEDAIDAIPAQTDYTVTVIESSPEGYAKAYTIKQLGADVATINIPKDMVVESGSVVTNPEGQTAGTYLKLVLANADESEIFINVSDLIEYVTSGSAAGDQIVVAVSADHKVTATLSAGSVTLAQLHADVQVEINKAHEHSNKTVLDGITAAKVTAWDAAEQNAKDYADSLADDYDAAGAATTAETNAKAYADGLADNYDAAGEADAALTEAKAYTDTALTWGSF